MICSQWLTAVALAFGVALVNCRPAAVQAQDLTTLSLEDHSYALPHPWDHIRAGSSRSVEVLAGNRQTVAGT